MRFTTVLVMVLAVSMACTPKLTSSKGFRLPDGDVDKGAEAFANLNCEACHAVVGKLDIAHSSVDLVLLGGEVTRVKTYGDLVTSIINPSHKIADHTPLSQRLENGQSAMEFARLNDVMTVTDLVNLVAYLQSEYKVVPPAVDPYMPYYPAN